MERQFTLELDELKERLLVMGGMAEHALQQAIHALSQHDGAAQSVLDEGPAVNQMQIEIDVRVVQLIARHQLMATDLRFALAVARINNELERIADQAVNMAEAALRMLRQPLVAVGADIPWMGDIVATMLRDSLDAFSRRDLELARSVLKQDDQVDRLHHRLLQELLTHMARNPGDIVPAFDRMLVTKSVERVGDHSTNIAEDVIYIVAGDDVRHHPDDQQQDGTKD